MDVHNAFLHGDLDEEVYMKLPPGFRHSHPGKSYEDYSLFSYTRNNIELRVLIYVDDLIICGNDGYMLQKFKDYLSRCFSMKLGQVKLKYALDIVADTGDLDSRPVHTPLEQNHHLATDDGPLLSNPKSYRPPHEAHMEAAIHVVRYLSGLPGHGILLKSSSDLSIEVYCDSDWSSCPLTHRSLSAYVVLLGGSPVSWKTKKQKTVSHSSAEAEYRSMYVALKEIKWLRKLLKELGIVHAAPACLFCDSKTAIYIATNLVFYERTKHIGHDCHAVRDAVREGVIVMQHVRTTEQLANIFTKALGRD
ncbi:PREDICTED: uncharacterized protein LOC109132848 [Camelina sativa]|uniref:Uncharacterized protein LOC109132848 n=1 Tax=Camelina sativa TaxID=90675 RepID=A0ABM1RP91_CAMSA|nr:PREDICTED: uncharacterized protein LOC109132848 [Camelina sativa]